MLAIGNRIRYYRKKNSITLQELSERTALSVGYLSNLERNITSPTIDNTLKICEVMAISIVDLINESVSFNPVIKKDDRQLVYSCDYRLKYEYITDINQKIVGKCQTLQADHHGEECCWGHETDEVGIIIKGSMVIEIYGERFVLEEGDCIYVKAFTKHVIKRLSHGECISYWAAINPFS
jgi:transcriptional regulator with XRE-family HTH domain